MDVATALRKLGGFSCLPARPSLPLPYNTDILCMQLFESCALRRCLCVSMSAPPYTHLQTVVHLCTPSTGHRASSQAQVHNPDPNPHHPPTHDLPLTTAPSPYPSSSPSMYFFLNLESSCSHQLQVPSPIMSLPPLSPQHKRKVSSLLGPDCQRLMGPIFWLAGSL